MVYGKAIEMHVEAIRKLNAQDNRGKQKLGSYLKQQQQVLL